MVEAAESLFQKGKKCHDKVPAPEARSLEWSRVLHRLQPSTLGLLGPQELAALGRQLNCTTQTLFKDTERLLAQARDEWKKVVRSEQRRIRGEMIRRSGNAVLGGDGDFPTILGGGSPTALW